MPRLIEEGADMWGEIHLKQGRTRGKKQSLAPAYSEKHIKQKSQAEMEEDGL
ncbi:MAG: hypothetical protein ACE5R6_07515 [Candidatus Heimdallarchaeota archaeon]